MKLVERWLIEYRLNSLQLIQRHENAPCAVRSTIRALMPNTRCVEGVLQKQQQLPRLRVQCRILYNFRIPGKVRASHQNRNDLTVAFCGVAGNLQLRGVVYPPHKIFQDLSELMKLKTAQSETKDLVLT